MREVVIGADTLLSAALAEIDGWEAAGALFEDALADRARLATCVADLIEFDRVARPLLGDELCDGWLETFVEVVRVIPLSGDDVTEVLRHPGGSLLERLDASHGASDTGLAVSLLGLDSRRPRLVPTADGAQVARVTGTSAAKSRIPLPGRPTR